MDPAPASSKVLREGEGRLLLAVGLEREPEDEVHDGHEAVVEDPVDGREAVCNRVPAPERSEHSVAARLHPEVDPGVRAELPHRAP